MPAASILQDNLPPGFVLDPVEFDVVLMVITLPDGTLRHQLRPAAELFRTECAGPSRVVGQLCKAAGKLAEALLVAGFAAGGGVAVDVGAAPGGWTQQLATWAPLVIAVDPAELHASVAALPNVVHLKRKCDAEGALAVGAALHGQPIDLLVCDMNVHPRVVLDALKPLLGMLRPGGLLLVTLKFNGVGREKTAALERMVARLEECEERFERVKLVGLQANTQAERTLLATRVGPV
jgi:23S rRNA U2552 (ribose-2'-O)-methylase RlmE/FtsJ